MPLLLFVCTGNTCRSPMSEYIFKKMKQDNPELAEWDVKSAGITAFPGQPMSSEAEKLLLELGVKDAKGHNSILVDKNLINEADLILTMTAVHREMLLNKFPGTKGKAYTLKAFAGDDENSNIEDPYGQSIEVYSKIKDEIEKSLQKVVEKLNKFINKKGNFKKLKNIDDRTNESRNN